MSAPFFTLILSDPREVAPDLEDALYQAGFPNAYVMVREGRVMVEFERGDRSSAEAVRLAACTIFSLGYHPCMTSVA